MKFACVSWLSEVMIDLIIDAECGRTCRSMEWHGYDSTGSIADTICNLTKIQTGTHNFIVK